MQLQSVVVSLGLLLRSHELGCLWLQVCTFYQELVVKQKGIENEQYFVSICERDEAINVT